MLSSRGDSYKAHGLSVHGGVMRGVWCLERFGEHSQQAGDQFKKTGRQKSTLKTGEMSPVGRDSEGKFVLSVLFSSWQN